MHVVTHIRCDEIVPCDGVVAEGGLQLRIRTYVADAASPGYIVEEHERIVSDGIQSVIGQGAIGARDAFLICRPGDARRVEQGREMAGAPLMVDGRGAVVADAEVGAGFEP